MSEIPDASPTSESTPFGRDRLVQAILEPSDIRVLVVDASATAFEAEYRHLSGRCSAEIVADLCAGAMLLGADLKNDERLSFQARVSGPIGGFLCEVDRDLNFRGSTHKKSLPDLDATEAPPSAALGTGHLQVLRSTGRAVVYQGITEMESGAIAADFERHLSESQQVASKVRLKHAYDRQLVSAQGFMIQALPAASPADFDTIAAALCARAEALEVWPRDPEALLEAIASGLTYRIVGSRDVRFRCRCSRERVVDMLRGMGPPEDGSGWPEVSRVVCAFCGDAFEVPPSELV
jgi:molecular chaperone Hsp33